MGNDLISRSALEQSFDEGCVGECGCCEHHHERHVAFGKWEDWCKLIRNAPTIDAVVVVHGRWKQCFEDWRHQIEGDECSACGFQHYGIGIDHYLYCPNCGAKMDGGAADV